MFGLTQIILALSPLTVAKAASEASDKRQMERQGYLDRDSLETLEARLVEAEKMLDIFEGKANQTAKWSKISRSISARITELTPEKPLLTSEQREAIMAIGRRPDSDFPARDEVRRGPKPCPIWGW